MWGHALHSWKSIDDENNIVKITGHGSTKAPRGEEMHPWASYSQIYEGDLLVVELEKHGVWVFKILSIEYRRDPKDMFKATIKGVAQKEGGNWKLLGSGNIVEDLNSFDGC